jgi:hypothetical protein
MQNSSDLNFENVACRIRQTLCAWMRVGDNRERSAGQFGRVPSKARCSLFLRLGKIVKQRCLWKT